MTVTEVSKILKVSKERVRQLCRAKRLSHRVYEMHSGERRYVISDAIPRPPLRKYTKPKLRELQGRGKP